MLCKQFLKGASSPSLNSSACSRHSCHLVSFKDLAVRTLLFANACLLFLQVEELAECIGSALIQKGFKASPEQFIGIFSQNRPEVVTTIPLPYWAPTVLRDFTPVAVGPYFVVCFLLGIGLCGFSLESYRYKNLN